MGFEPNYTIRPATAKALMSIETSRAAVERLPSTPQLIVSLRESARLLSTHYSTQIEGNRLTVAEVEKVVAGGGSFPGRERDEREVRNYYRALERAEALANTRRPVTEANVRTLHGLVMDGKAKATPYRDGQNVIRDGGSRAIIYMPPEAKDVPDLMRDLAAWTNAQMEDLSLPVPVIAALVHYQFATIHPYYDGNGRTARLLTTIILHRCGYGLKGIYSLEEYYAKNLAAYYEALTVGDSHNYYMGRDTADISGFVEYFCSGMADAFSNVLTRAESLAPLSPTGKETLMRELRPIQRQVLGLFMQSRTVASAEVSQYLGLSLRAGRTKCLKWVQEGFLVVDNASRKARSYRLADKYSDVLT